jgi:hypothetical protein
MVSNLTAALKRLNKDAVIPSIVEVLSRRNTEVSKSRSGCIHPSSLCKKCPRALFFQLTKAERNPTVIKYSTRLIWDTGNYIEDQLVKYLRDYYKEAIEQQVLAVDNDYNLRGYLDVVISLPESRLGVEIKSSNDFLFKKTKKTYPPEEYVWQATTYYKLLKLDKLIWLYYNKNTSDLLEIDFKYSEEIWDKILKKCYEVNKSAALNIAPKMLNRCKPHGDIECEYKNVCLKKEAQDNESKGNN